MPDACENCGATIGRLETPFVWRDQVVCGPCYGRLSTAAAAGGPIPYASPHRPPPPDADPLPPPAPARRPTRRKLRAAVVIVAAAAVAIWLLLVRPGQVYRDDAERLHDALLRVQMDIESDVDPATVKAHLADAEVDAAQLQRHEPRFGDRRSWKKLEAAAINLRIAVSDHASAAQERAEGAADLAKIHDDGKKTFLPFARYELDQAAASISSGD